MWLWGPTTCMVMHSMLSWSGCQPSWGLTKFPTSVSAENCGSEVQAQRHLCSACLWQSGLSDESGLMQCHPENERAKWICWSLPSVEVQLRVSSNQIYSYGFEISWSVRQSKARSSGQSSLILMRHITCQRSLALDTLAKSMETFSENTQPTHAHQAAVHDVNTLNTHGDSKSQLYISELADPWSF